MTIPSFPLAWPEAKPRRPPALRRTGRFTSKGARGYSEPVTIAEAVARLQREIDMIGARHPVISSNLELRLDGLPRSGQREPTDPGVAVYFLLDGHQTCLPCDTYGAASQNIAAVAAHIEATRAIERHGVATVAEMFTGFQALPAPGAKPWWDVLGVPATATIEQIEAAYRKLAAERHPDKPGGSDAMMADLNRARDIARKERV